MVIDEANINCVIKNLKADGCILTSSPAKTKMHNKNNFGLIGYLAIVKNIKKDNEFNGGQT